VSTITELVDAFEDATWACSDYHSIHDYPAKMDAAKTALLAAVAELERIAEIASYLNVILETEHTDIGELNDTQEELTAALRPWRAARQVTDTKESGQ
jgi:hypothetical protein